MSEIKVRIGKVKCRECGEEVEVELPDAPAIGFAKLLVEVEQRAAAKHTCKPKVSVTP